MEKCCSRYQLPALPCVSLSSDKKHDSPSSHSPHFSNTFAADDRKETCFGYVDKLDEVSDLYRKKEARNGCLLQNLTCSLALNI